ncbi:MAG TPA: hypothetical protein PL163_07730 [Leptospiraceae bacterium]|nr:hypothetical protein [Leptospiraceae bacterium]
MVMLWTALLFIYSCSSGEVLIQKKLTGSEQILGKAKGEGCGSMWIISTAYNFIPIGLNGRIQTAYDNALNSVSGAKGLINISIEETWTWYVLGTARCTTITGDAVK